MEAELLIVEGSGNPDRADDLVTRARAGEEAAFHEIFSRYGRPILSFIFHLIGERNRAEELLQETFIRAFRNLGSLRTESKLSTWLFGIARNVVLESIKEGYRRGMRVSLEEQAFRTLPDERPLPEEQLLSGELERAIVRALEALSEDHRIVFVLREFNKMSYQEISNITGSSIAKLKTDLHRARQNMRERLRPYRGERAPGAGGES